MKLHELTVSVGYAVPASDALIFNIHFARTNEPLVWSLSLSYNQLCFLDNFINKHSEKLKHTVFPVVKSEEIATFIKYLKQCHDGASSFHHPKVQNANLNLVFNRLDAVLITIEKWLHIVILRNHVFPKNVYQHISELLSLPYGPLSDEERIKLGLKSAASNDSKTSAYLPRYAMTPSMSLKNILAKGSSGNLKPDDQVQSNSSLTQILQGESEAEASSPPLLRITVERVRVGQAGAIEYKISIRHSRNPELIPPHTIFRRFKEFATLQSTLSSKDASTSSASTNTSFSAIVNAGPVMILSEFPHPPAKSMLGMSLDESELSQRTRALDEWLREVCSVYLYLSANNKQCVRAFLGIVPDGSNMAEEDFDLPEHPKSPGGPKQATTNNTVTAPSSKSTQQPSQGPKNYKSIFTFFSKKSTANDKDSAGMPTLARQASGNQSVKGSVAPDAMQKSFLKAPEVDHNNILLSIQNRLLAGLVEGTRANVYQQPVRNPGLAHDSKFPAPKGNGRGGSLQGMDSNDDEADGSSSVSASHEAGYVPTANVALSEEIRYKIRNTKVSGESPIVAHIEGHAANPTYLQGGIYAPPDNHVFDRLRYQQHAASGNPLIKTENNEDELDPSAIFGWFEDGALFSKSRASTVEESENASKLQRNISQKTERQFRVAHHTPYKSDLVVQT